ncbi:MAG: type II toxin-antitoxin system HicB family antitoxin [Bacteroidia bacterium]|nr:type II toxin-antitoxin system HicB family antitoxin [Bacteroidia bacterium]
MLRYAIIIEKVADGGYGAYVPDLPGCVGMGSTHEEVMQNIMEGIKFHLDGLKQEGFPIPSANAEAENLVFEYTPAGVRL